jgi:rhodanese-related sulfurtransferase
MIWMIIVLVLLIAAWYAFEGYWDRRLFAKLPGRVCENLRPSAAMELLRSSDAMQVLDVRSAAEFAAGALAGATNISIADPDFCQRVGKLDRTKPVLVYCAGGYRSRKAVPQLLALGFESIHHLHRGYHSWTLAGLPTSMVR